MMWCARRRTLVMRSTNAVVWRRSELPGAQRRCPPPVGRRHAQPVGLLRCAGRNRAWGHSRSLEIFPVVIREGPARGSPVKRTGPRPFAVRGELAFRWALARAAQIDNHVDNDGDAREHRLLGSTGHEVPM